MSNSCQALATKQELANLKQELLLELESKLDKDKEDSIIQAGGALGLALATPAILNAENIARAAANGVSNALSIANTARQTAQTAIGSAGAAAGNAAKALGNSARALGQLAGMAQILTTVATLAITYELSRRISNLTSQFLGFKAETNKDFVEVRHTADSAYAIANTNKEDISNLESRLNETNQKVQQNKHQIQLNETQIELIKKEIAAFDSRVTQIRQEMAEQESRNQETLRKASEAISAAEQANKKVNDINTKINNYNQKLNDSLASQGDIRKQVTAQQADINANKNRLRTYDILQTQQRIQELVDSGIIPLTRKRNLDQTITSFNQDIQTLKSGLEVSNKLTNGEITTLRSGLEVSSRLTNGEIGALKSGLEVSNRLTNNEIAALKSADIQLQNSAEERDEALVNITNQLEATNTNVNSVNARVDALEVSIPTTIDAAIDEALVNIPTDTMNEEQYNTLTDKLDNLGDTLDNINPYAISIAVGSLPILHQILDKAGRATPCQAPLVVPPVHRQTILNNTAIMGLQTATIAQNQVTQGMVSRNFDILAHASHGLEATRTFLGNAWKSTLTDKVLGGINVALNLHNAMMLSNNIGQTLGDIASLALNTLGIRDETDSPIDVNSIISAKFTSLIQSIIGSANYATLQAEWVRINRILQAGQNILSNLRNIADSTNQVLEDTGENVAIIGNALRDSGILEYNAYGYMPEQINAQSKAIAKLESLEDATDSIYSIVSDISDIREEYDDMIDNRKEFKEALDEQLKVRNRDEEKQNRRLDAEPDLTDTDIQQLDGE